MCHRAQRKHIISSLDTLLYQLHTLSFLLSPSVWSFVCRLASQFQCSKPRDLDATASRSLRFFFSNILLFNASSIWYHATQGTAEGRAVVLDFVGIVYKPPRSQLLFLDFFIIFLQLVLTTIAYETSLLESATESKRLDVLLPMESSLSSPQVLLSGSSIQLDKSANAPRSDFTSPYVIDLRLSPVFSRLRHPPLLDAITTTSSLPLPNTTSGAAALPPH